MSHQDEESAGVWPRERTVDALLAQRDLGGRLRTLRQWCRASQRSFARVSGISATTLRRYEACSSFPRPAHLATLGEVLNTSLVFLVRGEGPPSAEDLTVLRLAWIMTLASPGHRRAALELAEGILSQMPATGELDVN